MSSGNIGSDPIWKKLGPFNNSDLNKNNVISQFLVKGGVVPASSVYSKKKKKQDSILDPACLSLYVKTHDSDWEEREEEGKVDL